MKNISPDTLSFLSELKENNNKPWFEDNKPRYQKVRKQFGAFMDELLKTARELEPIYTPNGKKSIFRIHRDLRFTPDKRPYKQNLAAVVKRGLEGEKAPFYIHIQPGACFIGGGIYQPASETLRLIRQEIEYNTNEWEAIVGAKTFTDFFGQVEGERLQRAPKGYSVDHPQIYWLRFKQFLVRHPFSDNEVAHPDFLDQVMEGYQRVLPFLQFLDVVLQEAHEGATDSSL